MFNNHMHVFTIQDVPEKFLPLQLVRWIAKRDWPVMNWVIRHLNPFTDNDVFDKYLAFIRTAKMKSQKEIFENCKKFYPEATRFVALAMDLKYMGAGKVPRQYEDQLEELAALESSVYKFIHADPRRYDIEQLVAHYVRVKGFKGVKLYPPIGYFPYDERLQSVYKFCDENKIPVISHSSPNGPVYFKGSRDELFYLGQWDPNDPNIKKKSNKELCALFCQPDTFAWPMLKYPNVNFCIAHFGGDDWDAYMRGEKTGNWVQAIIDLITRYDNCWTDISFTMHDETRWPMFKILLTDNNKLRSRVLFGSDYYVNETVTTEREWSIKFRAFLGEELFQQIAEFNPRNFFRE